MARSRQTTATSSPAATSGDQLTCPECGKRFSRAASLGAHRNRAHGISGASKRRTRRKPASAPAAPTNNRRRRRTTVRRPTRAAATASPTRRQTNTATIDRNQLLQTLFPNGVPAREDAIRRVASWLDEAEQLAEL
jgi:hypothetical protein